VVEITTMVRFLAAMVEITSVIFVGRARHLATSHETVKPFAFRKF
jgi:hypothetical protein